jgi:nitrogen fixation/metabolism regulation signal transduction histidine kinase
MDLRTRILVGYGYMVSLIVVSAVAAALGFHHLGSRLSEVLEANFASIRWSMEMVEALERQDSALLAALLGDDNANRAISESETAFLNALERARSNVTEDRESDVIDQVDATYEAYREARVRLLAEPHEYPLAAYNEEAFPRFDAVKSSVVDLLDVNHQAMVAADNEARAAAKRRAAGHGLVVLVALLSFAWLSRALRREVLVRLTSLQSAAKAMASGDLERRADATRADELGLLAEQLNSLLDRDVELRGRMDVRLAAARDMVLGLLAATGAPSVLFAPDGRVVASTVTDAETEPAREALSRFRSGGENGDSAYEVAALAAGSRSVGWLVSRRRGDDK